MGGGSTADTRSNKDRMPPKGPICAAGSGVAFRGEIYCMAESDLAAMRSAEGCRTWVRK